MLPKDAFSPKRIQQKHGPEFYIRRDIMAMLDRYGWIVRKMVAGAYNEGWPDLYAIHKSHGVRWIEVKLPNMVGSRWTPAQKHWFPIMENNGCPIWVLVAASESEYKKLFMPSNWFEYMLLKD